MNGYPGMGVIPDFPSVVAVNNVTSPLVGFVGRGIERRPSVVDRRHLLDKILDQGPTNSCVGCAYSTALFLRGQMTEYPIPRPSQKAIYDGGRGADDVMQDWGCRPSDAMEWIRKHGLVAEDEWPLFTRDASLLALSPPGVPWINTPPDFSLYHRAIDARVTAGYYADLGDIAAQFEAALAIGHFPVYAQYVRHDYPQVRGKDVYDVPDAFEEGLPAHMQAVCGYDEDSFHVVSSWGLGHGDAGIVRVAKRVIASRWSFGRAVIDHAPKSLGGAR